MKKTICVSLFVLLILTACGGNNAANVPPSSTSESNIQNPPTAPANVSGGTSDCSDSAAFVSDVTVNDYDNFDAGEKFTKTWRVKNSGACVWSDQYSLVFKSGKQLGLADSIPLKETEPGNTLDISVDMTAPDVSNTYRADFEIHSPSGAAIPVDDGTTLWVIITVGNSTAATGGGGNGSSTSGAGLVSSTCAFSVDQTNVNDVITAVNAYRAQNGLPAYTVNAQLTQAAQAHSEDMACNNLFVHVGSNGSTPQTRVGATGYAASSVIENVYGSYPALTGQGAINWWAADQSDPRHNANLLSETYKEIGVGYTFFNNYGYYVVDFAAP